MTADFKRVLIANRGEIALAQAGEGPLVLARQQARERRERAGAGETVAQGTPLCRVRPAGDPDHGR